ncbi:MAG: hypothetical protein KDD60_11690, partial [Bdellovibrionales bacterium]|nr:hypothetical protein [Bdellovibrionales bacterium]
AQTLLDTEECPIKTFVDRVAALQELGEELFQSPSNRRQIHAYNGGILSREMQLHPNHQENRLIYALGEQTTVLAAHHAVTADPSFRHTQSHFHAHYKDSLWDAMDALIKSDKSKFVQSYLFAADSLKNLLLLEHAPGNPNTPVRFARALPNSILLFCINKGIHPKGAHAAPFPNLTPRGLIQFSFEPPLS